MPRELPTVDRDELRLGDPLLVEQSDVVRQALTPGGLELLRADRREPQLGSLGSASVSR